jgi:hypothetical protein
VVEFKRSKSLFLREVGLFFVLSVLARDASMTCSGNNLPCPCYQDGTPFLSLP